jgi:hypothetical protein
MNLETKINIQQNEEKNEEKSNVYWNQDIEKIVHEIGEKSKSYKIMHIKEAKSISFIYDLLMYSGIILGPIAGLLSAIGSILSPNTSPSTLPIISGCVAFFSGIVVAITKYGKFEEKNSHHKIAASKYTSLESNIRRQLILYRDNRQNAEKYLEWIGNSFDDLFSASPLISDRIYDEYIKIARKKGLLVPDDYVININNHKINESIREIQNVSSININTNLKKDEVLNDISHFPDINKFSDNMMSYELQRMMK